MKYLADEFSLSSLADLPANIIITEASLPAAAMWVSTFSPRSIIGFYETARAISGALSLHVEHDASFVKLNAGDEVLVAMSEGPRFRWLVVTIS